MKLRWTPSASRDLDAIEAYIEQDNPFAASQTILTIIERVGTLVEHPALGRPGRITNTRELVITDTPCIVAYRVSNEEVAILAVVHGARKWPKGF